MPIGGEGDNLFGFTDGYDDHKVTDFGFADFNSLMANTNDIPSSITIDLDPVADSVALLGVNKTELQDHPEGFILA